MNSLKNNKLNQIPFPDYVCGGELFTHLYHREKFAEKDLRIYIAELVIALEQLHELGVIYRDIKLENVLIDKNGHIVLTDFGLSRELAPFERAQSYCGTMEYMAPGKKTFLLNVILC